MTPASWLAFAAATALLAGQAHAQDRLPGEPDSAVVARLRDAAAAGSQVMRTATILSDVFGPRLAGSPGYQGAAEWAVRELASYGLANARLEAWGTRSGRSWATTHHSVELVAPYYARLVAYPKAWSPPTAGVVRGTPVLVTDVRADSDVVRYGDRLRGTIVLLGPPSAGVRIPAGGDSSPSLPPFTRRWDARALDSLGRLTEPGSPKDYWEDAGGYAENVRSRQRLFDALAKAGVAANLVAADLQQAALVTAAVLYQTANLPEKLPRLPLPPPHP